MNTTSICVINGATIQVSNDEHQLVPINPICQALGVAVEPRGRRSLKTRFYLQLGC